MKKIEILILGGGMYVTGRGSDTYGTIIPSIIELKNIKKKVTILNYSTEGQKNTKKKIKNLQGDTNLFIKYELIKNLDKVLDKNNFDCAVVALPDNLHYENIKKIIQKKIHIITVKPFVTKINHALELIEIQKKNKLICQVDFHKRNDEANIILKNMYQNKEFGDLNYFTVEYSQPKNIPEKIFKKWSNKTNIFQYLGVHYVDLIYFITGAKPMSVYAVSTKNYLNSRKIITVDSITTVIQWLSKENKIFNSTLNVNWTDPNDTNATSDQNLNLFGTQKKYKSDQSNRGISIFSNGGIKNPNPYFSTKYYSNGNNYFDGYGIKTFKKFFQDVIDFKRNKKNISNYNSTSFRDALTSVLVTEGVNQSLMTSNKVLLDDIDNVTLRQKSLVSKKKLKPGDYINLQNFKENFNSSGISLNTLKKLKKNKLLKTINLNEELNFSHIFKL